jgi:hypothetical protein
VTVSIKDVAKVARVLYGTLGAVPDIPRVRLGSSPIRRTAPETGFPPGTILRTPRLVATSPCPRRAAPHLSNVLSLDRSDGVEPCCSGGGTHQSPSRLRHGM